MTSKRRALLAIALVGAMLATGLGIQRAIAHPEPHVISVGAAAEPEGDAGTTLLDVPITIDAAPIPGEIVTVEWATLDGVGTATAGVDYTSTGGTVAWDAADPTTQQVQIQVATDNIGEGNETIVVAIFDPAASCAVPIPPCTPDQAAELDPDNDQASATITDDDVPSLAIDDVTLTEGNAGTTTFTFTVTRTGATTQTVTVDYATDDVDPGGSPEDYAAASGTLTFPPAGDGTETFDVNVVGDTADEASETFLVNLSNVANATISDSQGMGTITDDDAAPTLTVDDVAVTEGNAGTTALVFTVTRTGSTNQVVTVDYGTVNATATAGFDYTSTSGTLTFPAAGDGTETITVDVLGDVVDEPNEIFLVNFTNVTNATMADTQAVGTITDDDATPTLAIGDVTSNEGNAGTTAFTFTVTKTGLSSQSVTVDYTTADGTATQPGDYATEANTLTFLPAGDGTETLTVDVVGDAIDELTENFVVNLSNPSGATVSDAQAVGTISNDDDPTLSINDVSLDEGDTGTTTFTFTVTRSASSVQDITVDYATDDVDPGGSPDDYAAASGTLTFLAAGDGTETFAVAVNGDATDENNETFTVNLSNAANATIADAAGLGTIVDDDNDPPVSVGDATVTEDGNLVFTVTLSDTPNAGQSAKVDYATSNGTAEGTDYVSATGQLTFPQGISQQTITVDTTGDAVDEDDETVIVTLSKPASCCTGGYDYAIGDGTGTGTITDDDAPAGLTIGDVTADEGNSGTTTFTFTVTRTGATELDTTVDYATADGTASQPGDYAEASDTLTFLAGGDGTETLDVSVVGDTVNEAAQTFVVNLSNATNATISDAQATGTISNDDAAPTLSINDVTLAEGNTGTTTFSFTVTRTGSTEQTVTADYATADGTATQPGDYATATGGISIPGSAGNATQNVSVDVVGETTDEVNETFVVNLTNLSNASAGDVQGQGTITNDDDPTLAINDVSVSEGNAGTSTATFTVTRTGGSAQSVTVDYATTNGTATAGSDYTAESGTVTIPASASNDTGTFTIDIAGDTTDEVNETYVVDLSNATNASIFDAQGQGTITNDDDPSLAINDVVVTEGNSGTTTATFTVTRTGASAQTVTVDYATANGSATQPADYASESGTVTIPASAGNASDTITIDVVGDTTDEANESFLVNLSNVANASLTDAQGQGTITNDDDPGLAISDVSVDEGSAGTTSMVFIVTRSGDTASASTVDFATANGTATQPADYASNSGTLTFAAADTSETITVDVVGDVIDEPDETLLVNFTNVTNATMADTQAVGTITDDDGAPTLAIDNVTVTEGNSGTTVATFTVTKTGSTAQTVTVDYDTADGTAGSGDYTAESGQLSFAAGDTTKSITIDVLGDTADEANETYVVDLSGATNATISDNQGTGTITDDDEPEPEPGEPQTHDFNGDGFADAVFGAPGEAIGSSSKAGAVSVIYGSEAGLTATGDQVWHQNTADLEGNAAANDRFGAALAPGNFNGDAFDDLAIGVPGETSGAGAVSILYGSADGLQPEDDQLWAQSSTDVEGTAEAGDAFGGALAAGDLNGDGFADLAIGAPGENSAAGAVNVLYGTADGLDATDDQVWDQNSTDIEDSPSADDRFGGAVAAGDVNGDGVDDLVVGVRGEEVGAITDAGAIHVIYGTDLGLDGADSSFIDQDDTGVLDETEAGDGFGTAVAAGDIDGDGLADVAVGSPREDVSSIADAGATNVLFGAETGLDGTSSELWHQNSTDIEGVSETGDLFAYALNIGDLNGDGFGDLSAGVPGEAVGSTTKAGLVNVIYGSDEGLAGDGNQIWFQNSEGIGGTSEKSDLFGSAVSSGDFDGDGSADLNVGAPGEDIGDEANAGTANVLYGADPDGLGADGDQVWHQNIANIGGSAETGDVLGTAVS